MVDKIITSIKFKFDALSECVLTTIVNLIMALDEMVAEGGRRNRQKQKSSRTSIK